MANPFRHPNYRRLEYFNEASTLVWCHCLFTFTNFVPDAARRYEMGYVFILLVIFNFLVNLLFVYWNGPPKLIWWLKKKYNEKVQPCRSKLAELKKTKLLPKKAVASARVP
jgi:hypothetical protein